MYLVKYQFSRQEVLRFKKGDQDSTSISDNVDDTDFIPPKTNSRLSTNPGRQTGQPKE